MKLYCYKMLCKDREIIDIGHMLGRNEEVIKHRLKKMLLDTRQFDLKPHRSFTFFQVDVVDSNYIKLIVSPDRRSR